jgi:hypothetical protein
MRDACYLLIPTFDDRFRADEAECFLPNGHVGPHRCKLKDGRVIEWESDDECTDCDPDECECFVWSVVAQ